MERGIEREGGREGGIERDGGRDRGGQTRIQCREGECV